MYVGTSKSHLYSFRLVNVISPGKISQKQIDGAKMTFKQMELINKFIDACKSLGVPDHEAFATVDLYEEQNMVQVITCISALMRKVRTHCYIMSEIVQSCMTGFAQNAMVNGFKCIISANRHIHVCMYDNFPVLKFFHSIAK